MSEQQSRFRFDFEWRTAIFTLLMFPFMIGLGFWQLHRADEKDSLAAAFEVRQQQPPAALATLWEQPAERLGYMPVKLKGIFLPDMYFLLDNQTRNGQVGYEVLAALQLFDSANIVLVNRGWLAGGSDRQSLPVVPVAAGQLELTGHIYVAPGTPFLLAEQQLGGDWPKRIQAVEMDKLAPLVAEATDREVFPYPVRIDASESGALAVDWQIVNMSSVKHRAYAVQWFAMAAALLVFFLFLSSNVWELWTASKRAKK